VRGVTVATLGLAALACSWGGYADASTNDAQRISTLEHKVALLDKRLENVNERSWQAYMRAGSLVSCVALQEAVYLDSANRLVDATWVTNPPHEFYLPMVTPGCWKYASDPALQRRNYHAPTGDVYP
jgi:uncharacterized coiled-coil protein SlyX